MVVAFTICSNNYLSQAKALGDSLLVNNPQLKFYIGLLDHKLDNVDYTAFNEFTILPVEEINIEGFNDMCERYNIVELNTSVKPFYFEHFFNDSEVKKVIYFDPDIFIYDSISSILNNLDDSNGVLTPHINTPSSSQIFWEINPLRYGLYNLGFIGLSKSPETLRMLSWWKERTFNYCYHKEEAGYFVDQLWASLIPIFFEGIKIEKNPGLNVAYWNFHERKVSKRNGKFLVNESVPLIFFHFSSYNPEEPAVIAKGQSFDLLDASNPLYEIFNAYKNKVIANGFKEFSSLPCHFVSFDKMNKERVYAAQHTGFKGGLFKMASKIKRKYYSAIGKR